MYIHKQTHLAAFLSLSTPRTLSCSYLIRMCSIIRRVPDRIKSEPNSTRGYLEQPCWDWDRWRQLVRVSSSVSVVTRWGRDVRLVLDAGPRTKLENTSASRVSPQSWITQESILNCTTIRWTASLSYETYWIFTASLRCRLPALPSFLS